MLLSAHRKRASAETDELEAAHTNLPAQIERHSLMARAVSLGDGGGDVRAAVHGVPADRRREVRLGQWHWIAGLVLTGSIIFHIFHATFWLDFWSIWVGPKDIPELKAELLRELGQDVPGPKIGQVSARQPPVSHGDRAGRPRRVDHRHVDDVARPQPVFHAQPVSLQRRDLGHDLRDPRPGGRRPRRSGHGARLLRHPAREVVDHQGDDPRLHYPPAVSRAPRAGALAGRRAEAD